jgi:hypothetical protein
MYTLIRFASGVIVEGVVLAKGRNRVRAAVAGFSDTIELRRSGLQWLTATGEPVEFDFLMSDAREGENVDASTAVRVAQAAVSVGILG